MFDFNEWWSNLKESILGGLYESLYAMCEEAFEGMFSALNDGIAEAGGLLSQGVTGWNSGAVGQVRVIAETVCIPIAACIITFIFCWELIHLVQDGNAMKAVSPDQIMFTLLKLGICLLACSKSFDIVLGLMDVGAEATRKVGNITAGTLGVAQSFADIMPQKTENFIARDIFELMGNLLLLKFAKGITKVIGVILVLRVNMWFIEFLIFAMPAALPFATYPNKEWSQIGSNYIRKMLAKSFEGFFMMAAFVLYGFVVNNLSGDFTTELIKAIGCGGVLVLLLFKAGQISSSVFNAH